MIELKTESELEIIRENCQILMTILRELTGRARPGISTRQLNDWAEELMREFEAESAFKGYQGRGPYPFPASICTSINHEIVHGIPSPKRILKAGDLLSIDAGIKRNGFYADLATTVTIEPSSSRTFKQSNNDAAEKLLDVAKEALRRGIAAVQPGNRVSDISHAIGSYVEAQGFSVVKRFVGHGVGRKMHEEPQIPNYGPPGRGALLKPGMVLAIEPMVFNGDKGEEVVTADGWTVVTPNGGLAAHFEAMVVVTERGPETLANGIF